MSFKKNGGENLLVKSLTEAEFRPPYEEAKHPSRHYRGRYFNCVILAMIGQRRYMFKRTPPAVLLNLGSCFPFNTEQ